MYLSRIGVIPITTAMRNRNAQIVIAWSDGVRQCDIARLHSLSPERIRQIIWKHARMRKWEANNCVPKYALNKMHQNPYLHESIDRRKFDAMIVTRSKDYFSPTGTYPPKKEISP